MSEIWVVLPYEPYEGDVLGEIQSLIPLQATPEKLYKSGLFKVRDTRSDHPQGILILFVLRLLLMGDSVRSLRGDCAKSDPGSLT